MDSDIAISIKDIHKEFILPQSKNTSMKQAAVNIVRRNNKVTQKVLDGVSFDIKKGEFFGIVGRNGSGKSTLLKLIAGVYYPTAGSIDVNGGLTPFIELGVGFNPELSGHDNVYLNGALLGFTRAQMDDMYDEIVEFAELGPFMDQKLKNYSSGMQVRLAFSIAIKAKNDILIFDEVLAVGDEAFQRKCLDVFEEYKANKQTVILVSHDMETVRRFCTRAALISDGELISIGSPRRIADKYSALNQAVLDLYTVEAEHESTIDAKIFIEGRTKPTKLFSIGDLITLTIKWSLTSERVSSVMVDLYKKSGEHVTGFNTSREDVPVARAGASVDVVLNLGPGKYYFAVETRREDETPIEVNYNAAEITIKDSWPDNKVLWSGIVPIEHRWRLNSTEV